MKANALINNHFNSQHSSELNSFEQFQMGCTYSTKQEICKKSTGILQDSTNQASNIYRPPLDCDKSPQKKCLDNQHPIEALMELSEKKEPASAIRDYKNTLSTNASNLKGDFSYITTMSSTERKYERSSGPNYLEIFILERKSIMRKMGITVYT